MLKQRFVVLFVLSMVGGAVIACSDPPSHPPPAVGGSSVRPPTGSEGAEGGADGGAPDAASTTDGGVCNTLDLGGALLVDRVGVIGDPPVAIGGTIEDGDYDLTDFSVYVGAGGVAGPTGISAQAVVQFSGGTLDELYLYSGSGPATTRSLKSGYSATGSTLATTQLCPLTGGGGSRQYSVNGSAVVLTDLTTKEAFTFTKR